jgi:hypothetical protein
VAARTGEGKTAFFDARARFSLKDATIEGVANLVADAGYRVSVNYDRKNDYYGTLGDFAGNARGSVSEIEYISGVTFFAAAG